MRAVRHKTLSIAFEPADAPGTFAEVRANLTMAVSIHDAGTHPVWVQGFGINHATFRTMQEVHDTFCAFSAPIRLDNGGCELIAECLAELGFKRPKGYFT